MQRAIHLIGLALFMATMAACEPAPVPVAEQPLILALARQPTSALYLLAQEHGLFKKHGLNVQFKLYPSGKRALHEGVLTGAADMANSFDTPVALAVFDHPELRILASTLRGGGNNFNIVARRDHGVVQPGDLRGRRLATQSASAVHFFLHQFLLENNLAGTDVSLQFAKIEDLPVLLETGQVDAVSVREPYFSECRDKLGERATVFSVIGIAEPMELLVTTEKLLRERPAVAKAMLAALLEAEPYLKSDNQTAALVARHLAMNPVDVAEDLPHYLTRVELNQSLLALLEELARWGITSGLVNGEVPDFLDILAPDALTELAPERVNLIR